MQTPTPVIDAHQHLWRYSPAAYPWIAGRDAALGRDFLPEHLRAEMDAAGVDGCVAVQACETREETEWLLRLAAKHTWIRGVVGWAPLETGAAALPTLETLAADPRLRGVRLIAQGRPTGYLLRDDINAGVALLPRLGLVYDILIYAPQLTEATGFVDRHPADQRFVLDHLAKPPVAAGEREPWATHLRELARRPNVVCKLSGLATEADRAAWTPADLRPYLEVALDAFGPDRLLFGSDWPVSTLATTYGRWAALVRDFVAPLSAAERAAVLGGNAVRVYAL